MADMPHGPPSQPVVGSPVVAERKDMTAVATSIGEDRDAASASTRSRWPAGGQFFWRDGQHRRAPARGANRDLSLAVRRRSPARRQRARRSRSSAERRISLALPSNGSSTSRNRAGAPRYVMASPQALRPQVPTSVLSGRWCSHCSVVRTAIWRRVCPREIASLMGPNGCGNSAASKAPWT